MHVEELEAALRDAADQQPPAKGDLAAVTAVGRRRRRVRSMAATGAVLLVVAGVAASALAVLEAPDDEGVDVTTGDVDLATGTWVSLPDPPLSPRVQVVGVWTGSEVLLVGGDTFLCPPGAGCIGPVDPPLGDGAILDPSTGEWRSIAPPPVPFAWASTAVIGTDVYFLTEDSRVAARSVPLLLRYSLTDDAWQGLTPPNVPFSQLVAAGDVLVSYTSTDELGEVADHVYDPTLDEWTPLPADPLSPSFDRTMVWADPHLYLFDKELVDQPGSDGPSITRVARLAPGDAGWERLPDSEIISTSPWYAEAGLLVNPQLGGADGGNNEWGRAYPDGGIFDIGAETWRELPAPPAGDSSSFVDDSNGVIGEEGGLIYGAGDGPLLDLASMTWIEMSALPGMGEGAYVRRNVVPAGRGAVAFGGEDWSSGGEVLGDAWIWQAEASSED